MTSLAHQFHIPVMGIGFTIDTPVKVAHLGISSVISLCDDILIEKMRKKYCEKLGLAYYEISKYDDDYRAKRITAYLNLIDKIVQDKFKALKSLNFEKGNDISKYFDLLPDDSDLKSEYLLLSIFSGKEKEVAENKLRAKMVSGKIDVNIMTKLDKTNYNKNKEPLPAEYNDACAALRGFAASSLNSSVIMSAGMNPRLYALLETLPDFLPNKKGIINKHTVIKVSDFRSALIQGKFLAKKGIWVSEYRMESGLNCGGHAFATNGFLMGPILEEFKTKKEELISETEIIYLAALQAKGLTLPKKLDIKITAQGGIGTSKEQRSLLHYYNLAATGWGTPFLLVPEAVNIDDKTEHLLEKAEEKDLYLSSISPLGIPFNSVRGNSKDLEKQQKIARNRPGSACPKKFLALNTEFTDTPICTASRQYQDLKLKSMENQGLSPIQYQREFEKVTAKACICVGLGTSALITNDIDTKVEGRAVSICPGPNLAYFSKIISLDEMVQHIYGKIDILNKKYRPHMFIKELDMYIDYLSKEVNELITPISKKQIKKLEGFKQNLLDGIEYYKTWFKNIKEESSVSKKNALDSLQLKEILVKKILYKTEDVMIA